MPTKEVAVIAGSSSLSPAVPRTGRLRIYVVLGLIGAAMLALGFSTMDAGDYKRYYRCAEVAFLHGQNPYACPDYFQAPPLFPLIAPFAALGMPLDALVWSLFTSGCAFTALVLLLATFRALEQRTLVLTAVLALCPFTLFLLIYQQASAVIWLVEAAALWMIVHRRYAWAALLMALSVFKPQLLAIILPLLIPLPRKYLGLAIAGAGAILVVVSWPYVGFFAQAVGTTMTNYHPEHATVELRELTDHISDTGWWPLIGYGLLVPPFLYFCYQIYRLWRAQAFDLIIVGKLLAAGLLFLPYNRAYDWVLAMPAYLVLWDLTGRRWTPVVVANLALAWIALPLSTWTFLLHNPISINPLPLVLVIISLERAARAHPERAAALRVPLTVPTGAAGTAAGEQRTV